MWAEVSNPDEDERSLVASKSLRLRDRTSEDEGDEVVDDQLLARAWNVLHLSPNRLGRCRLLAGLLGDLRGEGAEAGVVLLEAATWTGEGLEGE